MTIFNVKIILRSINIGRNNTNNIGAELFAVSASLYFKHAFSISITIIRVMRRSIMKHSFIDRVGSIIGEDASGEATNNFFDMKFVACFKDMKINEYIIFEHGYFMVKIFEKAADISG